MTSILVGTECTLCLERRIHRLMLSDMFSHHGLDLCLLLSYPKIQQTPPCTFRVDKAPLPDTFLSQEEEVLYIEAF